MVLRLMSKALAGIRAPADLYTINNGGKMKLTRINMYLDERTLERAMKMALDGGVPMQTATNRSAFVRWLVEEFVKANKEA